jgi:hypothetical protein
VTKVFAKTVHQLQNALVVKQVNFYTSISVLRTARITIKRTLISQNVNPFAKIIV